MRLISLLFITLLFSNLNAQVWSAPVDVSNMPGFDTHADFCIDSNRVIHVVWEHEYQAATINKIMYAKSTDDGQTWSEPVVISEDIEDLMGEPRIVVDSQNNLHVTYYYHNWENNRLHYRKCTNQVWGAFEDLLPGHSSIINCELVIDNDDRVYCFWILMSENSKFHYRYLENGNWSPVFSPFSTSADYYSIVGAVADSSNNLHGIGGFSDAGQAQIISYYYYDFVADFWQTPVTLGIHPWAWGYDIALDSQENPHLIWREFISGIPFYEMTRYSYSNGQSWTVPDVVTEQGRWQTMLIDSSNTKHTIESRKFMVNEYTSIWNLVYYAGDNWDNGEILTNSNYIATYPKLIIKNNTLYLMYLENSSSAETAEVYLMKRQLPTVISDPVSSISNPACLYQNSPNPFDKQTKINFSIANGGNTNVSIFNLKGQLVKSLISGDMKAGNHTASWNGTDGSNHTVASGIYFCRLQVGKSVICNPLTLIR